MLVGRVCERHEIASAIADVRRGAPRALAIRGESGIGKTALCEDAVDSAGIRTVRAHCVDGGSRIPYAMLHDLLRPLAGHVDHLPAAQRDAVVGLLYGGAHDPLTLALATLGMLTEAASEEPLLVLVDDIHWADRASVDALTFAFHRLGEDAVGLLATVRPGSDEDVVDPREWTVIDLHGLDDAEITAVVERRLGAAVAPTTAAELRARTGGNPLAVLAVAAELRAPQLAGDEALPDELGDAAVAGIASRLALLPDHLRRAIELVACSRSGAVTEVIAALESLDIHVGVELLEQTGLVAVDENRLRFVHPLVREACRTAATAGGRRANHRALAAASSGDDRTWHRAEATVGANEELAAELEALAERLDRTGASEEAARAWDRAIELTGDRSRLGRRLHRAGRAHQICGRLTTAEDRLERALEGSDEAARGEIQLLRGNIRIWRSQPDEGRALLIAEAERQEATSPYQAAVLLMQAVVAFANDGRLEDATLIGDRAFEVAARVGPPLETAAGAIAGYARALLGDPAGEDLVLAGRDLFRAIEPLVEAAPMALLITSFVGAMLIHVEDLAAAERMLDDTIAAAKRIGATGSLPLTLSHRADLNIRRGAWRSAARDADEALQYARANRMPVQRAVADTRRLTVEALQCDDPAAGVLRTELADLLDELRRLRHAPAFGDATRGAALLDLAAGNPERASRVLGELQELSGRSGLRHPGVHPHLAELAEARLRAGDRGGAEDALAALQRQAKPMRGRWPKAAAARIEALLAGDDDLEGLERAVERHEVLGMPFEHGRALLDLGARLRRRNRARDAREPLREALAIFEELGARRWALRAAEELRACGERRAVSPLTGMASLTVQEQRVANAVAAGATNREAGAELFLSAKTVENHLGRIYAKLGVRSRTELSRLAGMEDGFD